ncbi:MAG TPA: FKBP-type peptidyl-prolyl cis-trans isomerase [Nitrospirota bacterium]|nr:FKBP-type peptidyl-prolyl cis-trans isomerase [Nitrospirota bacterium]
MKLALSMMCCCMLLAGPVLAEEKPASKPQETQVLKTQREKASYAIGIDMGSSLKKNDIDVDIESLTRGIKDGLSGGKQLMTEQEMRESITVLQKDMQSRHEEKNKAFLDANKKKDGVVTLASGLQYKVITRGKGKSPKATDSVTVNYEGKLIDGTEFDSSYKRGQAATFPVNGVIRGWTEALQLMKEGAKWQLVIPPDLAYGPQGRPGIPPNSILVFDVELVSVNTKSTK